MNAAIRPLAGVVRKKMLVSYGWAVSDRVFALVSRQGRIVVRLPDAGAREALLALGATPWKFGQRAAPRDWLQLPEAMHDDTEDLAAWLRRAWELGRTRDAGPRPTRPQPQAGVRRAPGVPRAPREREGQATPFDVRAALGELRSQLEAQANPARAGQEKRYLKSDLAFLGTGLPAIRRVTKSFARAHPELDRAAVFALVDRLWKTKVYELRAAAVAVLELRNAELLATDLPVLIGLVRTSKTWALVDWLATKVIGPVVAREPAARKMLKPWAADPDFWVRRTALLAWHDELLAGRGDFAQFARLARPMLAESEFFIRKAIGWVLRSTARRTPERTIGFVAKHATEMSGLTFREAVRNLPDKQQRELSAIRASATST